ncbi:MAG: hypothetical protein IKH97_02950, partial [Bacteroidales bacterium]|nr:hypothetical protein [Bacteroidales bacterium]
VSQSIDNKAKTLVDSLDGLSTLFKDKNQETSEYHLRQYKQNKVSFILIIILSVINLLGLIGVIIMYLFANQSF